MITSLKHRPPLWSSSIWQRRPMIVVVVVVAVLMRIRMPIKTTTSRPTRPMMSIMKLRQIFVVTPTKSHPWSWRRYSQDSLEELIVCGLSWNCWYTGWLLSFAQRGWPWMKVRSPILTKGNKFVCYAFSLEMRHISFTTKLV